MTAPGSEDGYQRTNKPSGLKRVVKEEYDREVAIVIFAVPNVKHEPIPGAAHKIETLERSWDRAGWDYNYSQLKMLLKTDPVFLILKPKLIRSLDNRSHFQVQ